MTEKQWYEDIPRNEMADKHVRAVMDSGTVVEGCLKYWNSRLVTVYMGSMVEGIYVLVSIDHRWQLMKGVKRLDLVWDEREWDRIKLSDAGDGDVLVVRGELYPITEAHFVDDPVVPVWWSVASDSYIVAPDMVSCALRRKAKVPVKPGFYKDRTGAYWVRSFILDIDKPWRAVDSYAFDSPVRSEEEMLTLMPLTPVHFVDGRAPEPGDELASVMRVTSKGVTFTTEAA